MLRQRHHMLKQEINISAQEMLSSQHADPARHLKGNLAPLLTLDQTLKRLEGYQSLTQGAASVLSAQQRALTQIEAQLTGVSENLIGLGLAGKPNALPVVANEARERLGVVMATLNGRFGERSLFAGVATDQPALLSAEELLAGLRAELSTLGAATVDGIVQATKDWFFERTGFSALIYQGDTTLIEQRISDHDHVRVTVSAQDQRFSNTLAALSLAALADGFPSLSSDEAGALARHAGQMLLAARSERLELAAEIGRSEAKVADVQAQNTAQSHALRLSRQELIGVDPMEAATRLQAASDQLDLLYAVTARVSRLSLVHHL